ncbi:MAG: valine--tRNA ligase [Candidatus Nomurabacteria bacterium]|nr:MAG: valine--tRNA ligase [Candidatus Nomurabacteria bacterium]
MKELSKTYNPKEEEKGIYEAWEKSGAFNPDKLKVPESAPTFSIALPPPNTTANLHMGHAVMIALQDTLVRYHRMKGERTLWLPGTDHAAIATQNVVEKKLKAEKKTKDDLGREKFLKLVEKFVKESQGQITEQMKRLGASCDWSRERFTLDEGLSKAVQTMFIQMYEDGLIYRGQRVVNWCTRCQSTLADDEVEYKEEKAPFYYFKYGPVIIGTARPETKFGDKVIIVHPDDTRYRDMIDKEFALEWINGPITARVIADESADPKLGSGAMTITPGHSLLDFELAKKYQLPVEKIINEQGKLTEAAGTYAGIDVQEARKKVVEILQEKGLVDHIDENYNHNLATCYRCGTALEPLPSEQWFISVDTPTKKLNGKSLKQRALEVATQDEIAFVPSRFKKIYQHWMENLHDWNISRQIWYGHRLPVWERPSEKNPEQKEIHVGEKAPKGKEWQQSSDTLDTWFSSGLWTFSTLGWPKQTEDLKRFHPTSVMETGYDILFFWVARMILMSTYALQEVPFQTVYLHGLVRDEHGRKMSKSLGNGIDPLEMADKYGADATRLSLIIGTTPGNDTRLSEQKIAAYRNFVNKLWNISRFALLQGVEEKETTLAAHSLADQWILSRLQTCIKTSTEHLNAYRFSAAAEEVYTFAWHEFADWYLEVAKTENNPAVIRHVLEHILKMLHPYLPFFTERIWRELYPKGSMLIVSAWPQPQKTFIDLEAEKEFQRFQQTVQSLRAFKAHSGISTEEHAHLLSKTGYATELLEKLTKISFGPAAKDASKLQLGALELSFPRPRVAAFAEWLEKEGERLTQLIAKKEAMLNNPRIPEELRASTQEDISNLKEQLSSLSSS